MLRLFAVTAPGLEPFTRQELITLGFTPAASAPALHGEPQDEAGGVEFETDLAGLYRANLHLRTANRILMRMGEFYSASFSELRKKASRFPWESALRPGQPVAVRVTCRKSRLYHSDAVAERIAGAIGDHLGKENPLVKFDETSPTPAPLVVVRIINDQVTLSLDTSGALLHRRGYRLETAKAPLRETLAAGLILASGWQAETPFIDPFCGSGTLAIEAALIARRIAPGKNRRFACLDWRNFDSTAWKAVLAAAQAAELPAAPAPIFAADRDAGAIAMAQANAERAGVEKGITFACQAVSNLVPPPQPGWLVTNPPYGVRVSPSKDLRNLYSRLGDVLRSACPGWQVGILCSDAVLVGHTHLNFEKVFPLVNGGIAVRFYCGKIG